MHVWGLFVSLSFVCLMLGISAVLQKWGVLDGEGARKFIHISVSNWWLIAMAFFKTPLWACIIPALFIVVNALSHWHRLIPAMERTGKDAGYGTVYYAVSLTILALFTFGPLSRPYVGALGILSMGYGDGVAAIAGQRYGRRKYRMWRTEKSYLGSAAMFLFSYAACLLVLLSVGRHAPFPALVLASAATVLEAVTPFELDNLTVPFGVSLLYQLLFFV